MKNFEYCVQPLQSAEYYKNKLVELSAREKSRDKSKSVQDEATFKANTRELNYLLKLASKE